MNDLTGKQDLAGRVAIVTGASSGIGRATAQKLAARGAQVLAVGRSSKPLEDLARAHPGVTPCTADLCLPDAAEHILAAALRLGPPTILICAAGQPGDLYSPVERQSLEGWRENMMVNLDQPFFLTRLVAPVIAAEGWGRIVYVSSTAGQIGSAGMAPYCASKHGLIGLMRAVACDIGAHGATANAVCPGWVRTRMAEEAAIAEAAQQGITAEEIWRQRDAAYPRGRVLSPEEVADTISYLASDAAAGVNGEALTVALGGLW